MPFLLEPLTFPFFQRALLAGVIVGALSALLGIFVVSRKMSFFSDAIAHFAFTGIALGFLLGIDPILAAVALAIVLALGIGWLERRSALSMDATIGIVFSGAAAFGIFIIGLLRGYRADLFAYLFGDILAVSSRDVIVAMSLAVVVGIVLVIFWKPWLQITVHRELADVWGLPVGRLDVVFLVVLAVAATMSIKIVGILLMMALLVIPPSAAKLVSTTFQQMVAFSVVFGVASVVIGLFLSYVLNTASGPTIVLVAVSFFLTALLFRRTT